MTTLSEKKNFYVLAVSHQKIYFPLWSSVSICVMFQILSNIKSLHFVVVSYNAGFLFSLSLPVLEESLSWEYLI